MNCPFPLPEAFEMTAKFKRRVEKVFKTRVSKKLLETMIKEFAEGNPFIGDLNEKQRKLYSCHTFRLQMVRTLNQ